MAYVVTQEDLMLILSQSASPHIEIKVEVLDDLGNIIDTINGIVSGGMSANGESDVRRTANFVVYPTLKKQQLKLTEDSLLWLNKNIRISVGLYNCHTKQYKYYPLGSYVYTDTSGTYNTETNSLTVNCSDFMKKLDGTKNGQLGALITKYPAYQEDQVTGEVIHYNIIRNAVVKTLEILANITNYRVDDIGEYKAMPEYNDNWQEYRASNPTACAIPFDQEFPAGCSVLSILTTFRDLYPNYEMFFDMDMNTFICQLKPMCYEDDIYIDNDFLQRVLISEDTTVDMNNPPRRELIPN